MEQRHLPGCERARDLATLGSQGRCRVGRHLFLGVEHVRCAGHHGVRVGSRREVRQGGMEDEATW